MKKLILLFTFALYLIPCAFSQEYGWQDISDNLPVEADLSDVFFVSENEGWITVSSEAIILHTSDGGETFEIQTTQFPTEALYMIDENKGYSGGASGRVYRTTDGGENWTLHGSIGTTLTDISFPPNGETGYCCGFNGNIWSIDSTGVNKMVSNINGDLGGISFPINSEEGWVCGGSVILTYTDNIWGGAPNAYPSGGYNAIYMVTTFKGWAAGDGGIIIHTEDGMNWFEQTNPDPLNRTFFDAYFFNSNDGWAVGIGGIIIHTTNSGTTWTMEGDELTNESLSGVHFASPTNGYVVGRGKTLLKYTEVSGIAEERQAFEFELFPNPVSDKFEVRSAEFEVDDGKIKLYELSGKKVLEENIKKGMESIEIEVRDLESGMYLCKITIGNKSSTKKLIKE